MDQALDMYLDRKQIATVEEQGEPFYHVPDDARVDVAFYRNNIIHLFVPESLLATALLGFGEVEIDLGEARDQTQLLSRLCKYEGIYEERAAFENGFARTLEHFEASGWLSVDGASWRDGCALSFHAGERQKASRGPPQASIQCEGPGSRTTHDIRTTQAGATPHSTARPRAEGPGSPGRSHRSARRRRGRAC